MHEPSGSRARLAKILTYRSKTSKSRNEILQIYYWARHGSKNSVRFAEASRLLRILRKSAQARGQQNLPNREDDDNGTPASCGPRQQIVSHAPTSMKTSMVNIV